MRPTNREAKLIVRVEGHCPSTLTFFIFSVCGTHLFRVLGLPAVGLGVLRGGSRLPIWGGSVDGAVAAASRTRIWGGTVLWLFDSEPIPRGYVPVAPASTGRPNLDSNRWVREPEKWGGGRGGGSKVEQKFAQHRAPFGSPNRLVGAS